MSAELLTVLASGAVGGVIATVVFHLFYPGRRRNAKTVLHQTQRTGHGSTSIQSARTVIVDEDCVLTGTIAASQVCNRDSFSSGCSGSGYSDD